MLEESDAPSAEGAVQKVRFGNFEVMNDPEGQPLLLGKGTFGRTYQARHCFLDTVVALKIFIERYVADATVRQRFLTEARAVAKLSHPHIARLYDFGEMNGVLYYAMEYCGGGSLADHVAKNGALSLRRTIEIAQQISGALKCAHTAGFIHRDLKPSNIMLTAPDEPPFAKLIDFGLVQPSVPGATRSFSDDQSSNGAQFLGTPRFASPEQLRGEPMDVRTDLFSLGMTLWFLMAGGAPESGSSAEIAASRLNRESYAARFPANLPLPFRRVLVKLLEKDRKNRFATAADLFNSLNACAAALGFRRARDYTDPAAALEWEDAETSETGPLDITKVEPAELESVEAPLSSEFNIPARINEDFTGINYVADEVGKKGAMSILHVLHPTLLEDEAALDRFRVHIAQLTHVDVAEIVRPKAVKRYSDYVAVISDKPGGTDLLSVLRKEGTVPLVEAAPLLEKIADACDGLCAAGLPGAQLEPGRIILESANKGLSKARPWLYPRLLAVSEAPELASMNEPEGASETKTADMLGDPGRADNMGEHFASLVYRVVAGKNCPVAASLSSQAYVGVPGLSEESNRILSMVIARQVEDSSCGKVLREILNAEGIVPRVPGHGSAGFTERPGSSTVQQVFDEDVQFSVFRPATMSPGIWHTWLAFAYRVASPNNPDPIKEVKEQARERLGSRFQKYSHATQESSVALPRESTITIVPNVPKLEFNPRQRDFVWHESVHGEEFRARASVDSIGKTLRGKVTVFLGALVIAEINVKVVIATSEESASVRPTTTDQARVYRKIFASYSRHDAAIVDHFEKLVAAFGDRYLRDIRDIRAGEIWNERLQEMISEADLFQLFWSSNSMHSNYVRQEWEYALSLKRPNFVRPTFWEDPLPSDEKQNLPPDNLRALHFQRLPAPAPEARPPCISSKPPVPALPEVKVESKRAIETPVSVPISKPRVPEIVSKPAEARPKDLPATPKREEKQQTVREPAKPAPVVPPPVPATPRSSAYVEEETQIWDARKLKLIGIGIAAAVVAISLLYMGVKLLTKPSVKAPMIIARPSPAANIGDLFQGILKTGVVAIGGETTGTTLVTQEGEVFELNLGKSQRLRELSEKLNGKKVIVVGDHQPRTDVEIKQRRIILVKTLRAAD